MKHIKIHTFSEIGPREENQDAYCIINDKKWLVAAVCDGLGGHKDGKKASNFVTSYLQENKEEDELENKIHEANCQLLKMEEHGFTTVAAVQLEENGENIKATLCNCGDSRIYKFSTQGVVKVSRDHTTEEELLKMGMDTEEARYFRKLTSCMGTEDMELEKRKLSLKVGECLMLASDGVWELFEECAEWERVNQFRSSKEKIDYLMRQLQYNKGDLEDNATCIFIDICSK